MSFHCVIRFFGYFIFAYNYCHDNSMSFGINIFVARSEHFPIYYSKIKTGTSPPCLPGLLKKQIV
jgi:hypothetical protein